jgi:hypothetical protein
MALSPFGRAQLDILESAGIRWQDLIEPKFEQFEDVFRHPLQAISNPLWLIGRWRAMNFCQQKPKKLESIIEIG